MGVGLQITELGVYGVPVSITLDFLLAGVGLVTVTEVGLICLRDNNAGLVNLFAMNRHEVQLLVQELGNITRTNVQSGLLQLTATELGAIMQRSVNSALRTQVDVRQGDVILHDLTTSLMQFSEPVTGQPVTRITEVGWINLREID